MAAPTYVTASAGTIDISGAWTATGPAPGAAGRIVILQVVQDGTSDGSVTFTSATNIENLAGTDNQWTAIGEFSVGSTDQARQYLWIGRSLSTSAPTFTGGNVSGEDIYYRMYVFDGVSTGTTLADVIENGSAGTALNGTGTSTSVADTGVTTLGSDRLALNFIAVNDDPQGAELTAMTGETGGDWTYPVAAYGDAAGTDATIALVTATIASAGTIDGGSDAITSGAWGVVGFALLPTGPPNHVLVTQDIANALTIDATTISQNHVLTAQDATLALSIDNATITQNHVIQPQDISLALTEDATTIAETHVLTAQDIALSLGEDSTTVTETNFRLTTQDIALALTEDSTTLAQNHVMATQDVALALTEDNATISQNHVVPVADIALALSTDNTTVAEEGDTILATQDIALVLTTDNTTLSQNHIMATQDIALSLTTDNTTLTQNQIIVVQDILHSLTMDSTTLTQNHIVVTSKITLTLTEDNATLSVLDIPEFISVASYRILRGPRTTRGPRQYSFSLPRLEPRQTRPPRSS